MGVIKIAPVRVAVVVDRQQESQVPLIEGLESVLRPLGMTVLVVVIHPLHPTRGRVLQRMISTGLLQGIVVTAMNERIEGNAQLTDVLTGITEVPVVSVGTTLTGRPAVLPDRASSMNEVLRHLVLDCGRRRPLLATTGFELDGTHEREGVFRRAAATHGIELPARAVLGACFDRDVAHGQMTRRLSWAPVLDFDAVVAATDEIALGVLSALSAEYIRVPDDVSVVSFGNTEAAYFSEPLLSSFEENLHAQGRAAGQLLAAVMAGTSTAQPALRPGQLVVRRSSRSAYVPPPPPPSDESAGLSGILAVEFPPATSPAGEDIRAQLAAHRQRWLPRTLDRDFNASEDVRMGTELRSLVFAHPEPVWWRQVLRGIEIEIGNTSPSDPQAKALVSAALSVCLHIERALGEARAERDRIEQSSSHHILALNRALAASTTVSQMTRTVTAFLPRLHIRRCFLILAQQVGPGAVPAAAQVILAYRDGRDELADEPVIVSGHQLALLEKFEAPSLLPPALRSELDTGTFTLQPLFSAERWFGFLLHEQVPLDRHTGESLRLDISRALEAFNRAHDLTHRASELETLVTARTMALESEISVRRAAQEDLRRANEQLQEALLHDGLTGLQNRPALDAHLERAWSAHQHTQRPLSVLMCDVDHFKLYNDSYGHLAGDDCLRQVAAQLGLSTHRGADLVARFGGEEFALVLPDTDSIGALVVAERVLELVREAAIPHRALGPERHVTVSVGVATTRGHLSAEALMADADRALYGAKEAGRDRLQASDEPVAPAPPAPPSIPVLPRQRGVVSSEAAAEA